MKFISCLAALSVFFHTNALYSVSHAYVSNNSANTVSIIDISTNTVSSTVSVGTGVFFLAATPDGSEVYVANTSGTVQQPENVFSSDLPR